MSNGPIYHYCFGVLLLLLLLLNIIRLNTKPSKNNNHQRIKAENKTNTNGHFQWFNKMNEEIWLKKVICDIGISKKITRNALYECTRTHTCTHTQRIERNVIDFNLNISWYFFNGTVAHWSPTHSWWFRGKKSAFNPSVTSHKCIYIFREQREGERNGQIHALTHSVKE